MASTKGVHRVLVADDDAPVAALLREALSSDGHVVVLAKDGGEALKALASAKFSLLVVDYQMPVKTGVEVIREIRARGEQTPALLISSHLPDEVRRGFTGDDRVAFLDKPFSLADLRNTVDLLVRVRS